MFPYSKKNTVGICSIIKWFDIQAMACIYFKQDL